MGNPSTEHSRKLRQDTAARRAKAVVDAGGWKLTLLLQPEPAKALRDEIQRTEKDATAIISELLLKKNRKTC